MWEPRHLTTVWTSTVCYRDSFTLFTFLLCFLNSGNLVKMEDDFGLDNPCSKPRRAFGAFLFAFILAAFYGMSFICSFPWNKSPVVGNLSGNPSDTVVCNPQWLNWSHLLLYIYISCCAIWEQVQLYHLTFTFTFYFLSLAVASGRRRFQIRNRTFLFTTAFVWSRDSVVGIATGYGLESREGQEF
jgi:hypothetical protein